MPWIHRKLWCLKRINEMMNTNATKNRGYTLIELLLYVVILGMLLGSVVSFFGMVTEARVKNQTVAEVDEQGTMVMDYMTQTIRNASSISAPAAGGVAASSLTLVVPTAVLSPTIFSLSGTTLQIKEGTAAAVPLTNGKVQISGLSFKNLTRSGTSGIVQVSFTISRVNPNNRNEFSYQKTFTGSAELGL